MTQEGLPRATQDALFIIHKNAGVLILLLMVPRLVVRLRHPPAPSSLDIPRWQRQAAGLTHFALYVLMFVLPISGYLRVRLGGFPIVGLDALGIPSVVTKDEALAEVAIQVHGICAFLLIALLALHIGATLQHALFRRDGVWSRIWPFA